MKILNKIKNFLFGPIICSSLYRTHNFITLNEKLEFQDGNFLYTSVRTDICKDCGYIQYYPFKFQDIQSYTSGLRGYWSKDILDVLPKEIIKDSK